MEGMASEVVFPERGAMIATATSSNPMRTSWRLPCRLPRRMPVSFASMSLASFRLGRRERAFSVIALAVSGSMSRAVAMSVIFFRPPLRFLYRAHRTAAVPPRATTRRTGTMRVLSRRDVSPASGHSCSGWSRAVVGWYGAVGARLM